MAEEKKGFFRRLVSGLTKTRDNIVAGFDSLFRGYDVIDEDFYEELEEILIMGDIGINATTSILEKLREKVAEEHIRRPMECKQLLINSIKEQMYVDSTEYEFENRKSVILVIGVNGVGKTTSVGKLAGLLKAQGKRVILAAADTFRAAAGEQLTLWANRAGVEIIGGQDGADPASVVYDAVAAAKARHADVLICDTAGRLHNKKNLMQELGKIYRILEKEYPEAYLETLVVLDGTTGQNALAQARQFSEVTTINGIILTKLDGTAKGGIAVAIQSELDIPVKYIGVGEKIDDLQKFDADAFVNALFDIDEKRLDDSEYKIKIEESHHPSDGEDSSWDTVDGSDTTYDEDPEDDIEPDDEIEPDYDGGSDYEEGSGYHGGSDDYGEAAGSYGKSFLGGETVQNTQSPSSDTAEDKKKSIFDDASFFNWPD